MPQVTIDEQVYEFAGQPKLLQFCLDAGAELPHFCYHPAMSIPANCRQCLVEIGTPVKDRETGELKRDENGDPVIQFFPKLMTSCSVEVTDGMVVKTHRSSDVVLRAQKDNLEFLLINHPLDCPICDQAGHCPLQIQAYKYGPEGSRFEFRKVHKPKKVTLGPRVMLDAERCINCTRCTRFTDEISKSHQLSIVQRGVKNYPLTAPGEVFDEPYSMNVIDVCPVGALTSIDFRFRARIWEMSSAPSITVTNAKGSNCEYWVRDNLVLRITPRQNLYVNDYWLPDEDRMVYPTFNENRPTGPSIRSAAVATSRSSTDHSGNGSAGGERASAGSLSSREKSPSDGESSPSARESSPSGGESRSRADANAETGGNRSSVSWEDAYAKAADILKELDGSKVLFIGSARATVEDNYLLKRLAGKLGADAPVYIPHIEPGSADGWLITDDKTPNADGCRRLGIEPIDKDVVGSRVRSGEYSAVYILEDDPVRSDIFSEDDLSDIPVIIHHYHTTNKTLPVADVALPAAMVVETVGTYVNEDGHAQRVRPAKEIQGINRTLVMEMGVSRQDSHGTPFDRWHNETNKINCKPSWEILPAVAEKLGHDLSYKGPKQIMEEIAESIEAFEGATYAAMDLQGIRLAEIGEAV